MKENIEKVMKILEEKVNARFAKEIVCIILLISGVQPKSIKDNVGATYKTIRKYREYIENGKIEEILEDRVFRNSSELDEWTEIIKESFDKNPLSNLQEAQMRIEKITGIKRTIQTVGLYLKKHGLDLS